MPGHTKGHFDVLDGLRGIAALVVMLGHACQLFFNGGLSIFPRSNLSVAFFFALSGFVIAGAYEDRLRQGMPLLDFMRRRIIRLYPLIIVAALIGTAYFAATAPAFWSRARTLINVIGGALALPTRPGAFSFGTFPINPPEWSLFNELLAYAAYGVLLARLKTLPLILISAAAAVAYSSMALITADGVALRDIHALASSLIQTLAMFSAGILLWRAMPWVERISFRAPTWLLAGLIIFACMVPPALGGGFDLVAMLGIIPAVLVLGAARGRGGAHQVEHMLGALSFPVYVLHWTMLLLINQLLVPLVGPVAAIAIACAAMPAYAWILLKWADEPTRAWLLSNTAPLGRRKPVRVTV